MSQETVKVAVTGAAGQIGYALLFQIASGAMFGPKVAIELQLLELEAALPRLEGVVLELHDCAFPLLKTIKATAILEEAFDDVDWALLVGSVPRKAGMERSDLLKINGPIFTAQGAALSQVAKKTCKVLVVGNPCNTNAYIAKKAATNLDPKNFFALMQLDQNRAMNQLAQKAGVDITSVKNVVVWGNHSATQYPDFMHAMINGKKVSEVIVDEDWLKTEFISTVQKRGAQIIAARGSSSAASAAQAVVGAVKNIITPTHPETSFSMAVCSDGSYGVPPGVMFGFPLRSDGNKYSIVQNIHHESFGQDKLDVTLKELLTEKEIVDASF